MKGILKFTSAIDKEVGVSAFLPYSGHVTRNIVKMMNGDMMFTIRLSGAAHQSADISDLNGWHSQFYPKYQFAPCRPVESHRPA